MAEARFYSWLCGALLSGSVLAFICSAYLDVSVPMAFVFLVGVPLAWCSIRAELARRESLQLKNDEDVEFEHPAPRWLWVAGPLLALMLLPGLFITVEDGHVNFSAQASPGQVISERNGHYYIQIEQAPRQEIAKDEYERRTRHWFKFAALGLAVMAFISLVLWQQEAQFHRKTGTEG